MACCGYDKSRSTENGIVPESWRDQVGEEREEAKQIHRKMKNGGTLGDDELEMCYAKLLYLLQNRKVMDEEGTPLFSEEEVYRLYRARCDCKAKYYFEGLRDGYLPYDPDYSYRYLGYYNRRGSHVIDREGMKEARKHLRKERIAAAIKLRDKYERAVRGEAEHYSTERYLGELLGYMAEKRVSFRQIGRTKRQILGMHRIR